MNASFLSCIHLQTILHFVNKLTLLVMNAVIWCCVSISLGLRHVMHMRFSGVLSVTSVTLLKRLKRFFINVTLFTFLTCLRFFFEGFFASVVEWNWTDWLCRSIINVMQEKQDRQERDMAILKNDIAKLRRDLTNERELVHSLRAHAADASWAIADVKRGQDQVTHTTYIPN